MVSISFPDRSETPVTASSEVPVVNHTDAVKRVKALVQALFTFLGVTRPAALVSALLQQGTVVLQHGLVGLAQFLRTPENPNPRSVILNTGKVAGKVGQDSSSISRVDLSAQQLVTGLLTPAATRRSLDFVVINQQSELMRFANPPGTQDIRSFQPQGVETSSLESFSLESFLSDLSMAEMKGILSGIHSTPQSVEQHNQLARAGNSSGNFHIRLTVPMQGGRNEVYNFILEPEALTRVGQLCSNFLENRQGTPLALGNSSCVTEIPLDEPLASGNLNPASGERGSYKLPTWQHLTKQNKGFFSRLCTAFGKSVSSVFRAIGSTFSRCFHFFFKKSK